MNASVALAAAAIAKRAAGHGQGYTQTYTTNDGIEITKSVFRQVPIESQNDVIIFTLAMLQAQTIIRDSMSGTDLLDALNILIIDADNAINIAGYVLLICQTHATDIPFSVLLCH